jgi:hypothetical protein
MRLVREPGVSDSSDELSWLNCGSDRHDYALATQVRQKDDERAAVELYVVPRRVPGIRRARRVVRKVVHGIFHGSRTGAIHRDVVTDVVIHACRSEPQGPVPEPIYLH